MASNIMLTIQDANRTAAQLLSICDTNVGGKHTSLKNLIRYLQGLEAGAYSSTVVVNNGAVQNTCTITVSAGGSINGETMSLCGTTFTATSGTPGTNEFAISATAATQAASMVAAFNASTGLTGVATATNLLGVITVTALPGNVGNALAVSESLTNVAVTTSFETAAAGTNGTRTTLDFS